jgi:lipopolysaccharide export LptBFGC system permease protein LptF
VRDDTLQSITPAAVRAALQDGPSDKLKILQRRLHINIQEAVIDILAEVNTRLVFGLSCIPLIVIGIGLGIILRGGHLLSAFGVSAMPAGLLVVFIMMGKNVAKNSGVGLTAGLLLMWAGFALMILLAAVILHKLLKN